MSTFLTSGIVRSLYAIGYALCTSVSVLANDPSDPAAFKIKRLQKDKDDYREVTGNNPTLDKLVGSLDIKEATGKKLTEVGTALSILSSMPDVANEPSVVSKIETCYAQNSLWSVKVKCADALLDLNRPKGILLAEQIMQSSEATLDWKLMMCLGLVRVGELKYFGFARDAYANSTGMAKRLARQAIEDFKPYNGQPWNANGEKIDTVSLLSAQPASQGPR